MKRNRRMPRSGRPAALHLAAQRSAETPLCQGFVQGSVGAAIGGSCAHPLDLIKAGEDTQKPEETQSTKLRFCRCGCSCRLKFPSSACCSDSGRYMAFWLLMGALEVAELGRLLSLRMGPHIVKNEGVLGLFKGSAPATRSQDSCICIAPLHSLMSCVMTRGHTP